MISIYQENLHDHEQDQNHDNDHQYRYEGHNNEEEGTSTCASATDLLKLSEERATCHLHKAFCHLKNKNYADSIIICTDVLMDGVQILPITGELS